MTITPKIVNSDLNLASLYAFDFQMLTNNVNNPDAVPAPADTTPMIKNKSLVTLISFASTSLKSKNNINTDSVNGVINALTVPENVNK